MDKGVNNIWRYCTGGGATFYGSCLWQMQSILVSSSKSKAVKATPFTSIMRSNLSWTPFLTLAFSHSLLMSSAKNQGHSGLATLYSRSCDKQIYSDFDTWWLVPWRHFVIGIPTASIRQEVLHFHEAIWPIVWIHSRTPLVFNVPMKGVGPSHETFIRYYHSTCAIIPDIGRPQTRPVLAKLTSWKKSPLL